MGLTERKYKQSDPRGTITVITYLFSHRIEYWSLPELALLFRSHYDRY